MINIIIPFRVKTQSLDKVHSIIGDFLLEIQKNEPGTLLYKSFQQKDDPAQFIHVMIFKDEAAQLIHRQSTHCKTFVDALYPLCEADPQPAFYHEITPQIKGTKR